MTTDEEKKAFAESLFDGTTDTDNDETIEVEAEEIPSDSEPKEQDEAKDSKTIEMLALVSVMIYSKSYPIIVQKIQGWLNKNITDNSELKLTTQDKKLIQSAFEEVYLKHFSNLAIGAEGRLAMALTAPIIAGVLSSTNKPKKDDEPTKPRRGRPRKNAS